MDLNKEFIGRVVYNDDQTFTGRCKIRVFGIFDDFMDEELPWFYPQSSCVFSSGRGAGSLSVPKINSIVRVKFSGGNIYSGEYTNIQNIDPALIDEIKDDYQNTHVIAYDSEKDLMIIYQPMTGYKMYLNGTSIILDSDGSIQLKHKNNCNVIELKDNKINITTLSDGGTDANGEINISSGATVNITAPTVNVNADSIALGNDAIAKTVKGDKLISVLKEIVTELNTKFPQNTSTLVGRSFKEILTDNVLVK